MKCKNNAMSHGIIAETMIHIGKKYSVDAVFCPYKLKIYGVVLKNVFITMAKRFIFLNAGKDCLVSGQNR